MACRYWPISFFLYIQLEWSIYYIVVFQKDKIFYHSFLISFDVYFLWQQGDIVNPGPQKKAAVKHFSCCHWNVNSLAANDYKTASLLEAYNAIHHYYLICVLETYLESSVSNDEKDILIKGSKSNKIYSLSSFNK